MQGERTLLFEELFFSITDKSGKIMAANNVFTRVSAFAEDELLGRPHNIIRHPDMPRSVFRLFWNTLHEGRPVVAYVKNLAKTGEFYWVLAFAFPCNGGYLSIRLKPGSALFHAVAPLYGELLETEKTLVAENGERRGLDLGVAWLASRLAELGYASYEAFMWAAMEAEMRHRDRVTGREALKTDALQVLFDGMSGYNTLKSAIHEQTVQFMRFSKSIRLLSMNLDIGSSRLSSNGKSLSVIATNLQLSSREGEQMMEKLTGILNRLNTLIGTLMLDAVTVRLQKQMYDFYRTETGANGHENATATLLRETFSPVLNDVPEQVGGLFALFTELESGLQYIRRFFRILQITHTMASIESARIPEGAGFNTLFNELAGELAHSEKALAGLQDKISATHYSQSDLRGLHDRKAFAAYVQVEETNGAIL
jgi:aerotaxis receptor